MADKDFAVSAVGIPTVGYIAKKPSYLVSLEETVGKTKGLKFFIAIDRPDPLNGFISVKGIHCSASEEEISANFAEILATTPKEQILDMMFPIHRVYSVRSLVFNANKPSTLVR